VKLPADYPMVALNYAAQRSELAKQSGLGKLRGDGVKRKVARPHRRRRNHPICRRKDVWLVNDLAWLNAFFSHGSAVSMAVISFFISRRTARFMCRSPVTQGQLIVFELNDQMRVRGGGGFEGFF